MTFVWDVLQLLKRSQTASQTAIYLKILPNKKAGIHHQLFETLHMTCTIINESISLFRSKAYMRGETGTVTFCIE